MGKEKIHISLVVIGHVDAGKCLVLEIVLRSTKYVEIVFPLYYQVMVDRLDACPLKRECDATLLPTPIRLGRTYHRK
jgi:translation elongation factor EF-Tu-like GTPase